MISHEQECCTEHKHVITAVVIILFYFNKEMFFHCLCVSETSFLQTHQMGWFAEQTHWTAISASPGTANNTIIAVVVLEMNPVKYELERAEFC